ncbi:MAG: hypothetical protein ACJ70V_05180, partial [Nitrososphaera sp.]
YRDSAEVAIALGEVKRKQGIRSAEEVAKTQRQVQRAEGRQPPHHQFQPLQLPRFFQEQTFQRIKVNSEIMRKNI